MHSSACEPPLASLARRCLGDLDAMADAFVGEVSRIPPYSHGIVALEDLRSDAHQSIELLVRLVGALPIAEKLAATSERIGRERARAGIPVQALLQGVRLDLKLLWSHLVRSASKAEKDVLLESASVVWAAVEQHTLGIQAAYFDEGVTAARAQANHLEQLFRQLIATSGLEPRVLAQLRTALGAREEGTWVVARCRLQDDGLLSAEAARLKAAGTPVHMQSFDIWPVLIGQLPAGRSEPPSRWLRDVPCGISLATTLATVPAATVVAGAIAAIVTDARTGPHTARDLWIPLLADRLGELGDPLLREVLRDLLDVPPRERDRLVDTAQAYLRTGSVQSTSAALYCHRNTVLQRLNRVQSLTGFDVTIPEQAAPVLFALRVMSGWPSPDP